MQSLPLVTIKHDTLAETIEAALSDANQPGILFELDNPDYAPGSEARFRTWSLKIALCPNRPSRFSRRFIASWPRPPSFLRPATSAARSPATRKRQAGYALFASLLFIVGYIWMRFQRIMFGLAAVVALVHDVLITLGVLALSGYVVTYLPPVATLLLFDPFKISLPIVAAFLTIIGYSLNDTIVVFDRIREVRGKSPDLTRRHDQHEHQSDLEPDDADVVDDVARGRDSRTCSAARGSTASRSPWWSACLVGTYSSIFIASPVLLWMSHSKAANPRQDGGPRAGRAGRAGV